MGYFEAKDTTDVVERFAPSPTGSLHLGHAFSAFVAWEAARQAKGRFYLRVDDLDQTRTRSEHVESIFEDLRWLGLHWDGEAMFASQQRNRHNQALQTLIDRDLVYACQCSRKEIEAAVGAPQEGADHPPAYPGMCRDAQIELDGPSVALRLNMARAIDALGGEAKLEELGFDELGEGPAGETGHIQLSAASLKHGLGDIVLRRRDGMIAYHLAVVVDDWSQQISHVTRACDLFSSTPVHRLIQALLDLPTPLYRHHRIIRDASGRRLAKRDGDMALSTLRSQGVSPAQIRELVSLPSIVTE